MSGSKGGRKSTAELDRIFKRLQKLYEVSNGTAKLREYVEWVDAHEVSVRRWLSQLGIVPPDLASSPEPPAQEGETRGETRAPEPGATETKETGATNTGDPAVTPSLLEEAAKNGVNLQAEVPRRTMVIDVERPRPSSSQDPLTVRTAQETARLGARLRELEKRAPDGMTKKGKPIGGDYTGEGRGEVAEEIAANHTALMEDLAVEADKFITRCGGIVWERWQKSGYRTEYNDPKDGPIRFVQAAIDFFSEFRGQVANLYDRIDDLEEENQRLRSDISYLRDQERGKQSLLGNFLTLKLRGVSLNRDELAALSELSQAPSLEEEEI